MTNERKLIEAMAPVVEAARTLAGDGDPDNTVQRMIALIRSVLAFDFAGGHAQLQRIQATWNSPPIDDSRMSVAESISATAQELGVMQAAIAIANWLEDHQDDFNIQLGVLSNPVSYTTDVGAIADAVRTGKWRQP